MKRLIPNVVKKARTYLLQLIVWLILFVLYLLSYFGVILESRKPSILTLVLGICWLFYICKNLCKCIRDEIGRHSHSAK